MAVITWLHLSDLHFGQGDPYDSRVVLDALLRDLRRLLGDDFANIDLVFVTGDVAFSGKSEQYELARSFFNRLLDILSLSPEKLYMVPGNHDVDWDLVGPAAKMTESLQCGQLTSTESRKQIAAILADPACLSLITRRLENYQGFVNSYFPASHLHFDSEHYFYCSQTVVSNARIAIYGLNTAWLFAPGIGRGELILGERQFRAAIENTSGVTLRIALLHHPFDWLADFDRVDVEQHLSQNTDFILHGHRHWQAFKKELQPGASPCVFAAGASYEGREHRNACNVVKLNLDQKIGQATSFRYVDESGGFWEREVLGAPVSRSEVWPFVFDRQFVPSVPVLEIEARVAADLVATPDEYFRRVRSPGLLHEVRGEHLVEVARRVPSETISFLEWMGEQDASSLAALFGQYEAGLAAGLAQDSETMTRFNQLRDRIVHASPPSHEVTEVVGLLLMGPSGGGKSDRLVLQIPKKDQSRPRLAQELRFSLYLANRTRLPIENPRIRVSLSAGFLSYPYQGAPLLVQPSEYWQIVYQSPDTVSCIYSDPTDNLTPVAPGRDFGIGTIVLLVPWGEADGRPVDVSMSYTIEAKGIAPVEGQLVAQILAALDFEEALRLGAKSFVVPAASEKGIDTGLSVRQGQLLRFIARGVISYDAGYHFTTSDGYLCTESGKPTLAEHGEAVGFLVDGDLLMRGQRLGALIGGIGAWEEGHGFLVGRSNTVVAGSNGHLYFGVNDVRGTFGDNLGSFEVAVTVD